MTPKAVNLFDNVNCKYLTIFPETEVYAPTGELLAFETYSERALELGTHQLTMGSFKVLNYKGYIVGIRFSTGGSVSGVYTSPEKLLKAVFKDFVDDVVSIPSKLGEHPMVYVVPEGLPGAGLIFVPDIAKLRENGENFSKSMSFVAKKAKENTTARQALTALGFALK